MCICVCVCRCVSVCTCVCVDACTCVRIYISDVPDVIFIYLYFVKLTTVKGFTVIVRLLCCVCVCVCVCRLAIHSDSCTLHGLKQGHFMQPRTRIILV